MILTWEIRLEEFTGLFKPTASALPMVSTIQLGLVRTKERKQSGHRLAPPQ